MEKTNLGKGHGSVYVSQPHIDGRADIRRYPCTCFPGISRKAVASAVLSRDHVLSNSWKAHVHTGFTEQFKEPFSFMKNYLILSDGDCYNKDSCCSTKDSYSTKDSSGFPGMG